MSDSLTYFGLTWSPIAQLKSQSTDPLETECNTDVILQLDSPCSSNPKHSDLIGIKRKRVEIDGTDVCSEPASLALGLGHSSCSSDSSKGFSVASCAVTSARETTDGECPRDLGLDCQLHLGNNETFSPAKFCTSPETTECKPIFDLQLSLSTGLSESTITNITEVSVQEQNSLETLLKIKSMKTGDEYGLASFDWELNTYKLSLRSSAHPTKHNVSSFDPFSSVPGFSVTTEKIVKGPVTCTSGNSHLEHRNTSTKNCQFHGCSKGARGASGLCIAHGGGRRCQKVGCHKGAEGKTVYCKAHGGGRRCQYLGCTKSAEGRTDYCIGHGGGPRCSHEGCNRAARGKSGLCIRHGGGKRCRKENCTKSAEGYSGLCIFHGGGRRCQFPGCTKGAQGSTIFCKAHGGGKRCTVLGCTKGAEGSTPFCKGHGGGKRCSFQGGGVCPKSVHGGTQFCVAHGGGKRCAFPNCTKSARGSTNYCVRHGGGKRCKFEGCGKSAQGSTDFCKAHGGGKRCTWGQQGSCFGIDDGPPCERFARGKVGLCAAHSALVQDHCIRGGGTLCSVLVNPDVTKEADSEEALFSRLENLDCYSPEDAKKAIHYSGNAHRLKLDALPEGRVHGGGLMSILSSFPGGVSSASTQDSVHTLEQRMSSAMVHEWI
ncbi:putative WRKY transcription factor 19 [Apostasia shenzhenica]|uniref:Putative WRKY transcription factor 19 n=1 Tax=Apostasia shenzhenica TaxID=1088818 RepID=A0A2I0BFS9_9ASPA|nr:putative WRKY transcription factor 19 [Apostasia shenzhenica]